jgi:hypothetical protein
MYSPITPKAMKFNDETSNITIISDDQPGSAAGENRAMRVRLENRGVGVLR